MPELPPSLPALLPPLLLLLAAPVPVSADRLDFSFAGRGNVSAIYGMLSRVVGIGYDETLRAFDLRIINACSERPPDARSELCFELLSGRSPDGRIVIQATSGPELGYGLGHYLRKYLNMSFSWKRTGGHHINLPPLRERSGGGESTGEGGLYSWPTPSDDETVYRGSDISYMANVVTFSYTFAFYDFGDWEYLLDWATLGGINLALAYTGQEEVYRKAFESFGVNTTEFLKWTNGPAYLAWSRGQSIHGVAQSPPKEWLVDQWKLQKQILGRMRQMGMVPILPAFQGNVPPIVKSLYPKANITIRPSGLAAWIDALDPLFDEIAGVYMKILLEDFGTDNWYEADGYFNMKESPWYLPRGGDTRHRGEAEEDGVGSDKLSPDDVPIDPESYARAKVAYGAMSKADPNAVWLYQGWVWRGFTKEQLPFMKGFIKAVPAGRFVVLDMYDEEMQQWDLFDDFSYFGAPFIWSVLHNFGGNTGLWGSLDIVNERSMEAYKFPINVTSQAGVGFAPEGFDQNPAYYSLLLDTSFRTKPSNLTQWTREYVAQRYGHPLPDAAFEAWQILKDTVYGKVQPSVEKQGFMCEKARDALSVLPLGPQEDQVQPEWYPLLDLFNGWGLLVDTALTLLKETGSYPTTLNYDVVNVGREVLAKVSNRMFLKMMNATTTSTLKKHGQKLLGIMKDADFLLCQENGLTMRGWIEESQNMGKGYPRDVKEYFELNARSQVTTWEPQLADSSTLTPIFDYANKHWGGLVGNYYLNRTAIYLKHRLQSFKTGGFNKTAYVADVASWSYQWENDFGGKQYPLCSYRSALVQESGQITQHKSLGSALQISRDLMDKYAGCVKDPRAC